MSLIVSSNEIDALARKAAKGAGMPWGLAADAGQAARWLADHARPGPELLADLLDWRDGRTHAAVAPPDVSLDWRHHPTALDAVVVGTVCADLADRLAAGPVHLGTVRQPLLLGFALSVAARRTGVSLVARWSDAAIGVTPADAVVAGPNELAASSAVVVEPGHTTGVRLAASSAGWPVDADAWTRLERYAHRTYAPDTDESRRRGAGATLIDD